MPSRAFGHDFARLRLEHVDAEHFDAKHGVARVFDLDVRLAENYEEIARAGRLKVTAHVQVWIHAGFEYRHATELVELCGMGVIAEGAGNERIEARVACFPRGGDEIGTRHGAELRADKDPARFGLSPSMNTPSAQM